MIRKIVNAFITFFPFTLIPAHARNATDT